jgi:hypothetical protein
MPDELARLESSAPGAVCCPFGAARELLEFLGSLINVAALASLQNQTMDVRFWPESGLSPKGCFDPKRAPAFHNRWNRADSSGCLSQRTGL